MRALRILRSIRGSLALEAIMVMVPMMILTMGIIESSALTLTQRLISMKATDIGRLITNGGLIGQSQAASMEAIRAAVCNQGILGLAQSTCRSSLMIDVRRVDGSPIPPMVVGGALNGAAFTYQATSGSDILLLRLALPFPAMTPLWNPAWNRLSTGQHLVTSASMFKTNPYAQYNVMGPTP